MAKESCRRVLSNLLQQNIYVRDIVPAFDEKEKYLQESYWELETVDLPNGQVERIVEKPYPHTPEQVASYADSCDYRLNLDSALGAPPKPNLGDVRLYQSMFDGNGLDLREKMLAAQAKYQEYLNSVKSDPLKGVEKQNKGENEVK